MALSVQLPLVATRSAVRLARETVTASLAQWGLSQLTEDATLVTSELVTNAVQAANLQEDTPAWQLQQRHVIELGMAYEAQSPVVDMASSRAQLDSTGVLGAHPGTATTKYTTKAHTRSASPPHPGALLISVFDRLPGVPRKQETKPDNPFQQHGRGLWLVEEITEAWGWYPSNGGKVVWGRGIVH